MKQVVLALVWLACGCAPTIDLAGDWGGSWISDNNLFGTFQLSLHQDGEDLEGTMHGAPCVPIGDFEGEVNDHDFRGTVISGVHRVDFEGTIVSNKLSTGHPEISGSFEVSVGDGCTGAPGTFHLKEH